MNSPRDKTSFWIDSERPEYILGGSRGVMRSDDKIHYAKQGVPFYVDGANPTMFKSDFLNKVGINTSVHAESGIFNGSPFDHSSSNLKVASDMGSDGKRYVILSNTSQLQSDFASSVRSASVKPCFRDSLTFVCVPSGYGKTTCRIALNLMDLERKRSSLLLNGLTDTRCSVRPVFDIDELFYQCYDRKLTTPVDPTKWSEEASGVGGSLARSRITRACNNAQITNDWSNVNNLWKVILSDAFSLTDSSIVMIHSPDQIPEQLMRTSKILRLQISSSGSSPTDLQRWWNQGECVVWSAKFSSDPKSRPFMRTDIKNVLDTRFLNDSGGGLSYFEELLYAVTAIRCSSLSNLSPGQVVDISSREQLLQLLT